MLEEGFRAALPPGVALVVESRRRPPRYPKPSEMATLTRAAAKRRRDFASGRDCARRALAELGFEPQAIPVGPLREPVWPVGATGSITHCRLLAAAAVCRSSAYLALGIDAEVHRPLDSRVRQMIGVEEEYQRCREASGSVHWDTVLFSAKESIFKAWSPIQRKWLGFGDAKVVLDPLRQTFRAAISHDEPGPFAVIEGVFAVQADLVLTAVVVPHADAG